MNEEPAVLSAPPPPLFRTVFETELGYVWNVLRRMGIPERDLEDVTHEVFIVVDRRLSSYDTTRALRPWLFGISFRVASAYRRKAERRRETLSEHPPEEASGTLPQYQALVQHEERARVLAALQMVPEDRRAVLIMHDLDEVSMREITDALGIPLQTGYTRLRTAREELKQAALRLSERSAP